jgi:hypothetical protein
VTFVEASYLIVISPVAVFTVNSFSFASTFVSSPEAVWVCAPACAEADGVAGDAGEAGDAGDAGDAGEGAC